MRTSPPPTSSGHSPRRRSGALGSDQDLLDHVPANSSLRRAVKRLALPLLTDRAYSAVQAISIARDIRRGIYSEPELALVAAAVRPGESAIDVGANLGMYVEEMSHAVGPRGVVYAFEPVPFTCMTLRTVVALRRLRNVVVTNKGCAQEAGELTFTVPLQDTGALSTGQAHRSDRDDARDGRDDQVRWSKTTMVTASVVALDGIIPSSGEISLIKCDIEGAELPALRGAKQIIERDQPTVICEINPWFLDGFGIALEDLLGFFVDRGYRCYHYDETRRRLEAVVSDRISEDNYVFVHPRRKPRMAALLVGSADADVLTR